MRKNKSHILAVILALVTIQAYAQADKYIDGELVLKLAKAPSKGSELGTMSYWPEMEKAMAQINTVSIRQVFPIAPRDIGRARDADHELARIYKLKIRSDVMTAVAILEDMPWLEYAEPLYQHKLAYTPNDYVTGYSPAQIRGFMHGHANSEIYAAWDSTMGDTSIVIGIIDTGGMPTHPSLDDNLQYNDAERYGLPGVDDDLNGYIDDVLGWDFADQDSDVTDFLNDHGVSVAGVSNATVDDSYGMFGVSFHCRYIPIKIENTQSGTLGNLSGGYEAITYAAKNGCQIINLSWGRSGSPSAYEQDVIRTIVEGYQVLIVAAAGNDAEQNDYVPASYDGVLSVGHTFSDDARSSEGTYSHFMDLTAFGHSALTTKVTWLLSKVIILREDLPLPLRW